MQNYISLGGQRHQFFKVRVEKVRKLYQRVHRSLVNVSYRGFFVFYIFYMPCTYILYSAKLNKYYVGACNDMKRRLYEHNIGHSKFTSTGIPWELKYSKTFDDLSEAKKFEMNIKK